MSNQQNETNPQVNQKSFPQEEKFNLNQCEDPFIVKLRCNNYNRNIPNQNLIFDDNEEKFNLTKKRDQIKTEYAINNNIPLIRIPYTHLEKLCLNDLLPNISTFIVR